MAKAKKKQSLTGLVDRALGNWDSMYEALPKMNEEQVREAIEREKAGAKRVSFLDRFVRRLVVLYRKKTRAEVLGK